MKLKSKLPFLALEDFAGKTEPEVRSLVESAFEVITDPGLKILIAYQSVGSYGCDSSAWYLLRKAGTGELFEAGGSHCSCHGFEGQWSPEPTTLEYLLSDKFSLSCGGYDDNREANAAAVKSFLKNNLTK